MWCMICLMQYLNDLYEFLYKFNCTFFTRDRSCRSLKSLRWWWRSYWWINEDVFPRVCCKFSHCTKEAGEENTFFLPRFCFCLLFVFVVFVWLQRTLTRWNPTLKQTLWNSHRYMHTHIHSHRFRLYWARSQCHERLHTHNKIVNMQMKLEFMNSFLLLIFFYFLFLWEINFVFFFFFE